MAEFEFLTEMLPDRPRVLTIEGEPMVLYGIAACEGLRGHTIPWHATTATIRYDGLTSIMWLSRLQIDLWQRHSPILKAI